LAVLSFSLVLVNENIVCLVADFLFIKTDKASLGKAANKNLALLAKRQPCNVELLCPLLHALAVLSYASNHSLPYPFRINKLCNNPAAVWAMNMKTLTTPIITRKNNTLLRHRTATGTHPN
jgi:hypothetical protein